LEDPNGISATKVVQGASLQ